MFRSELFEDLMEESIKKDNTHEIAKSINKHLSSVDVDSVIANPRIANDNELLQKHYTILLDYCYLLEEKSRTQKDKIESLNREIYWLNKELEESKKRENLFDNIRSF